MSRNIFRFTPYFMLHTDNKLLSKVPLKKISCTPNLHICVCYTLNVVELYILSKCFSGGSRMLYHSVLPRLCKGSLADFQFLLNTDIWEWSFSAASLKSSARSIHTIFFVHFIRTFFLFISEPIFLLLMNSPTFSWWTRPPAERCSIVFLCHSHCRV